MDEETKKTMIKLTKEKSVIQCGFTRSLNSLVKMLDSPQTVPTSTYEHCLKDLDSRYENLESKCDELLILLDEEDAKFSELNNLLSEKTDLLNDVRSRVAKLSKDDDAKSMSDTNTAELIKSFNASLTLPKPQYKKFDGNACDFSSFMSYIETYVESSVQDDRQRLMFLIDSCSGDAYKAVSFLSQCADATEGYKKAKLMLKDCFGGKHKVNRAVVDECTNGSAIKPHETYALKRLVISMKKAIVILTENGCAEQLSSTDKLVKIYQRLPRHLQNKWNDRVLELRTKDVTPSFNEMCELIDHYVQSRDNEYCVESELTKGGSGSKKKPVFSISESRGNANLQCIMCKESHYLNQCPEFLQQPLKERYEFVSKNQLCRNCFHAGHIANKCKRKSLCRQCSCKHNNLLHDDEFKPKVAAAKPECEEVPLDVVQTNAVLNVDVAESAVGLACVEVLVEGKDALYRCKAIVDPKSSANLCTKKLAKRLNLPCTPFKTSLSVATGTYEVEGRKISQAQVFAKNMNDKVTVNNVLSVDSIPLSMNSVFTQDDLSGLSHLEGIEIPYVSSSDEVDLLIGSGCPKAFHRYEERKGKDEEIYAVRQTLGWDLVGPKSSLSRASGASVFFTDQSSCLLQSPQDDLFKVFQGDFDDCSLFSQKICPSVEDQEAIGLVEKSTILENGQFCVGFPWKQDPANLPSSKEVVLKRLYSLKRRFLKDANLLKSYTAEMQKFIAKQYIEPSRSSDTQLCHYIPHHPVWHPRKGSLRIVWDCAVSLNDFLHEGPDILNSLVEVLIRFRRFKFAVCSDIRKMYLSVKVPPNDRGALRILWWPNGDLSVEPVEYRATVHIYGAKSSGFIANNCVKLLAQDAKDPMVKEALQKDLYVDDQVSSVQSEEEAIVLVQGMKEVLAQGGFDLTKFVSNSSAVLDSVAEEDRVDSVDLILGSSTYEHSTLGLKWEVQSDEIGFPCFLPDVEETPSRRTLLSVIARVYDPLGVVSPATLPIKILMQKKSSLGWDEADQDMCEKWVEFCRVMQKISQLKLPRCYKPTSPDFDDPVDVSLHGFSDASKDGYSAVVYVRQVSSSGQVSVSFVLGKSRVAPKFKGHIPQATIPKLELNAAALLTRLMQKVCGCLEMSVDSVTYWCDSQAVLSCICSTNKRFPVYWANRLAVILGNSQSDQWRFVPSKSNPADVGSRGIHADSFSKQVQFWIEGPDFLKLPQASWPETPTVHIMENVLMVSENRQKNESTLLQHVVGFYSCLSKLLRVIARLLRFMKDFKVRKGKELGVSDLKNAEKALVRFEQRSLNVSHLKRLKPFKDTDGLLRVHSRLTNASHLSYDSKYPVILPKDSHLTKLIVEEEHRKAAHMGPSHVLCQLRQRFWIVGGLKTVKRVLSSCRKCREENAQPLQQEMSPLPEERVQPSFPFQFVGLDYFGPFYCKIRRQRIKRYGCIFVCLATRAVHIECVNSLETSAFLCALSRFISRRGLPEKIFSDNATNFKGAQDELKNIVLSIDEEASKFAVSKGVQWHFHPPLGSHHGGHYERFIRTVRRVLRGITDEQEMSEDNLMTFLCEAEKIINDRPLTPLTDDPNDSTPITPNMILLLRNNSGQELFPSENKVRSYHRQAMFLGELFWKRWCEEYVPSLMVRQKWLVPKRNLKEGDLVLMCGEGFPRGSWPMARVVQIFRDSDQMVRKVMVKDKNGLKVRPITKLALLEGSV